MAEQTSVLGPAPVDAVDCDDEQVSGTYQRPLPRVSSVLAAGDAEDLRRYFRTGGLTSRWAQSPLAGMLAMLELFARTARPCERCGGDPVKWNGGTGFVDSETGRAPERSTAERDYLLGLLDIEIPVAIGDQLCRDCRGHGWVVKGSRRNASKPLTARPMGSSVKGEPADVDTDTTELAWLGKVSGKLDKLRHHQGEVAALMVLEAYYSEDGGSMGALWHLTPAGRKMLRNNPQKLQPAQFFANERDAQRLEPKPNRRALFEAAEQQAKELFETSCRLFNEATGRP